MKKSILLVLPISILCLIGCKGKDSKMPSISSQEFRNVSLVDQNGNKSPFIVTHFNGSPVGYLSLGKNIESIIAQNKLPFTTKYSGHKYIMHNTITDAECIIDFDTQTITYDTYDKFCVLDEPCVPIDIILRNGKKYFKIDKTKYEEKGNTRIVDMSSYNIPLYYDQSYGYIPLDIFGSVIAPFLSLFLSYNGNAVYAGNLNEADAQKRKAYFNEGNIFTKDYMEYIYNLLALELDFNFGLDERVSHVTKGKTIKFKQGNAYEVIRPYHDSLVSLKPGVSDEAYFKVFAENYDDGGHTSYGAHNCLAYEDVKEPVYGPEFEHTGQVNSKLSKERADKKLNPSKIIKDQTGKDNGSLHCFEINENEKIAFLTFDKFVDDKDSILEAGVTKNNYWNNTLTTVAWANKQLQEHSDVTKLVVDLSLNIGGSAVAEQFIASWLCDGVTTKVRNTKDETYQEVSVHADINMDGKIDEKDHLPENIKNVYCMVSASSFSCGNLLPYHLTEYSNKTKIMGECSGGGSCLVYDTIPTGLGVHYQISSSYQLGTKDSTSYTDFKSNEAGINSSFYQIADYSDENVKKFYNREEIIDAIKKDNNNQNSILL